MTQKYNSPLSFFYEILRRRRSNISNEVKLLLLIQRSHFFRSPARRLDHQMSHLSSQTYVTSTLLVTLRDPRFTRVLLCASSWLFALLGARYLINSHARITLISLSYLCVSTGIPSIATLGHPSNLTSLSFISPSWRFARQI